MLREHKTNSSFAPQTPRDLTLSVDHTGILRMPIYSLVHLETLHSIRAPAKVSCYSNTTQKVSLRRQNSDECDVLDKAALCIQQKCDESGLCVQQIDDAKEMKYPEEFRSRYAMFVNCNTCTSFNNREYHVRRRFDREPSRIPVRKTRKALT